MTVLQEKLVHANVMKTPRVEMDGVNAERNIGETEFIPV